MVQDNSERGARMSDQQLVDKAVSNARLKYRIETEAKIRLVYSEQALQAAKSGLSSLSSEYTDLANQAAERQKVIEARG